MKTKLFLAKIAGLALIGALVFTACDSNSNDDSSSWKPPAITDFMKVSGTVLSNGFTFTGSNLDNWRFNTQAGEVYSQEEVEKWVTNAVKNIHLQVLRMMMTGCNFESSTGTFNEKAFKQLDYLLAAASKNNIYILISLRDYLWESWPPDAYDPYWYFGGGTTTNPYKNAILENNDAKFAFKNFISYVLNRTNTVTGIQYKNDPHIFGWEIINEPNDIPALKNFYIEFH